MAVTQKAVVMKLSVSDHQVITELRMIILCCQLSLAEITNWKTYCFCVYQVLPVFSLLAECSFSRLFVTVPL